MEDDNRELLNDLKSSLEGFISAVSSLGLKVRLEEGYTMQNIEDLFDSIDWICKGVLLTTDIHGVNINEYDLSGKLDNLVTFVQAKDDVQVADVIEYEILPALIDIHEKL